MSYKGHQEIRHEALTEKRCPKCNEIKSISEFYEFKRKTKLGFPTYASYCKSCTAKYGMRYKKKEMIEKGKCPRCGAIKDENDGYYCNSCNKKNNTGSRKNAHAKKKLAIEYLGGKCKHCGLETDALSVYEFHHLRDKKYNLKFLIENRSWNMIQQELDKCILLCSNCHRILHWREKNMTREEEIVK